MPPLPATVAGQIHIHQEIAAFTALTIRQVMDVVGKWKHAAIPQPESLPQ